MWEWAPIRSMRVRSALSWKRGAAAILGMREVCKAEVGWANVVSKGVGASEGFEGVLFEG